MSDSKGTVLVVDDEDLVLQVASDLLRHLGYSVLTSPSGEKAIERIRSGLMPDLVLLDVIMPGLGGVETFRTIHALKPELPVLISTGYAERGAVQALTEEGVRGFVNKPYNMETLARRVGDVLG
ncbi:MAG: response regulator [Candidatus Latescibacteria bacterium]|nr:response regulator [Candidatus Latescibacterota bacterium]